MKNWNIDQLNPSLKSRIQDALRAANALRSDLKAEGVSGHPPAPKGPLKRIRQRQKPLLNKLEQEALAYLVQEDDRAGTRFVFRSKALVLALANGCKYTVDITGSNNANIHAWEVKGPKAWDDAIVKLKVAAREWPAINFYLMWKDNGVWQTQAVLP